MRRFLAIITTATMLAACSGSVSRELSPLLSTVPSRSIAIMNFDKCDDALALLLDSTSVLRSVDYKRFSDSEIILSYDYNAGLVPMLSIDAGRSSVDTSSAVQALMAQAEENGLYCRYTADLLPKRAALLLSPSLPMLSEAMQHISSGSSIMDAPGFPEAFKLSKGGRGCVILRNGSANRLLPRDFLKEYFPRKQLASLVSGTAAWTVMDFPGYSREGIGMSFYGAGNGKYLCEMFAALEAGECKLAEVAPDSTEFTLGIALKDPAEYLSAWQNCQDVRANLSRYNGRLAALKKSAGKSPAKWFAEKSPREIARVRWEGRELLLMRPAKKARNAEMAPNEYAGFIPALLGEAFRLTDDSCTASAHGWTVFGSAEDVAAWLNAPKGGALPGNPRKVKFYFVKPGFSIVADSNNTVLNVN